MANFEYIYSKNSNSIELNLQESLKGNAIYRDNRFTFLNLSKVFESQIDWNYDKHGKLWTYNLTYFEYLDTLDRDDGLVLIADFIEDIRVVKDGLEPFPISLRAINWIKFLDKHHIRDKKIDDSLYAQYYILLDNLEYHLLGNHLLENAFSLLFGGCYFDDAKLYSRAREILIYELDRQILGDGGHFELTPMYHQLMLFRLLDSINLLQNSPKEDRLLELLIEKASLMLGWLKAITYQNGDIPLLNDSTNQVAPTSNELFDYAKELHIDIKDIELNQSGYRKIIKKRYELVLDIGNIGADYIPGHAHSDTFGFELYIDSKPFIVDSGLSTYEPNATRAKERATLAHNTVEINGTNQSEVWGAFRVANRACVLDIEETKDSISATHDGYKRAFSLLHRRKWCFKEESIVIKDIISRECSAIFRLHFHPDITKKDIERRVMYSDFKLETYQYAREFNKKEDAFVLEIDFEKDLRVEINI